MDIYQHISTPEQMDLVLLSAQHGPGTSHELHRAYMIHRKVATDFKNFTNALQHLVRSGVMVTEPHPDPPKRVGRPPVVYRLADDFPPLERLVEQLLERFIGDDPERLEALEGYLQSRLKQHPSLV